MTNTKIFIDGASGTVGLQIHNRLQKIGCFDILTAPQGEHKNLNVRKDLMNEADIVVLCLPDKTAKEAVSLITNPSTKILDASSAHRTTEGWVYGLPELTPQQPGAITDARRVANPGCFATGAIVMLRPLIEAGLIPVDYPVSVTGVGGYSAGGRRLIEEWGKTSGQSCRHAIVTMLNHRHVPEIQGHARLGHAPICMFSIAGFPQGMVVQVPIALWSLPSKIAVQDLHDALVARYNNDGQIKVRNFDSLTQVRATEFEVTGMVGSDDLEIHVVHDASMDVAVLIARFDNLGKGAGGAAVRNLEYMAKLKSTATLLQA